ncbi:hypothetical protein P43SY_003926 [Pythium insidiosum]|uniref:Mediator of RNA polymerase II transcription subunit 10 n=1 Tax=Pythium insidiosum TaxID=114742 RepID=A0AAD5M4L2_PYTIN|nr:hypothetical protein ATCC90586_012134 [Pythium insidiosum]KAJ0394502.1 hypothetical protein P43SY_003926 [Pythium insidiosum]
MAGKAASRGGGALEIDDEEMPERMEEDNEDANDTNDDEEEEEDDEDEEKEHFFSDIVPSDRDQEDAVGGGPASVTPAAAPSTGPGKSDHERRAQVSASPYIAPFTPLSSPTQSRPKTPSSVSAAQRQAGGKKPHLVPMKNGSGTTLAGGVSGAGSGPSKVLKDDVIAHLPTELVDALMSTVQTLDKLILGVEDFRPEQLGFLTDKVNTYVELLKAVDATGATYDALLPLEVLEMLDGSENTNPELYTKKQLELCQHESERAAGKVETLEVLRGELDSGLAELIADYRSATESSGA